jgi:hypothetical protein
MMETFGGHLNDGRLKRKLREYDGENGGGGITD